jgi:peptidoglycan-associated lipoprotein
MSLSKYRVIAFTSIALAACSTTGYDADKDASNNASDSQVSELENKVGDRVFFEFDSSAITAEAQETLKKQAKFIAENPDLNFTIEGHCDSRGTRDYNLGLGERRANAVKQFLISLGVEQTKLTTVSYGKERPAVLGNNDWAWSQNRRGVTTIK